MDEALTKSLVGLVDMTKEGILKGVELVQAQAPDLINQLLRWKFYEALFYVVLGVLILLSLLLWVKVYPKLWKEGLYTEPSLPTVFSIVHTIMSGVFGIALTFQYLPILLQIHFAPKIFLIEYLTKAVRG